jgi:hypothetical protein
MKSLGKVLQPKSNFFIIFGDGKNCNSRKSDELEYRILTFTLIKWKQPPDINLH